MNDWTSVEKEPPDPYEYVLVYAQKEGNEPSPYSISRHTGQYWEMLVELDYNAWACGDLNWSMDTHEITHWRYLPKFVGKENE